VNFPCALSIRRDILLFEGFEAAYRSVLLALFFGSPVVMSSLVAHFSRGTHRNTWPDVHLPRTDLCESEIMSSRSRTPENSLRIGLSLLCYQGSALLVSCVVLGFSGFPRESAVPAIMLGQACAAVIWLWGVWLLVALFPSDLQLRHRIATVSAGAIHAVLVATAYYWIYNWRNPYRETLNWSSAAALGFLGASASISCIFYTIGLKFILRKRSG
jgi:hypothetical protein